MNDAATNFKATIEAYLPMIGQAAVIPHVAVEQDDDEMYTFALGDSGIFVTTRWRGGRPDARTSPRTTTRTFVRHRPANVAIKPPVLRSA